MAQPNIPPNITYHRSRVYTSYLKIGRYGKSKTYTGPATIFIQEFSAVNINESLFAKGIAICGPKNFFSSERGEQIAQGRADKVIERFSECKCDLDKYDQIYECAEPDPNHKRQKTMRLLLEKNLDTLERRLLDLPETFPISAPASAPAPTSTPARPPMPGEEEAVSDKIRTESQSSAYEPVPTLAPAYEPTPTPAQAPTPAEEKIGLAAFFDAGFDNKSEKPKDYKSGGPDISDCCRPFDIVRDQ